MNRKCSYDSRGGQRGRIVLGSKNKDNKEKEIARGRSIGLSPKRKAPPIRSVCM